MKNVLILVTPGKIDNFADIWVSGSDLYTWMERWIGRIHLQSSANNDIFLLNHRGVTIGLHGERKLCEVKA